MSEHVLNVTDDQFEAEVLKSDIPVVVDFWASWCNPCRAFAPTFTKVADEYLGKAKLVKVNVDESSESASRFGVRSIPTVMIFSMGRIVATKMGAMSETQLKSFIDENI